MINILSYVGMSLQSEVCLWALLGVLRTIFDATLFKVNSNLKQVWQMSMPAELSLPVQRMLRTMISGVMLVQCFTVYLYLAAYIVLLYPVFLEERPILVLPWLLLAAIRKLLCELTCLALGLGTCLLLGPARTPCIKFLIMKVSSLTLAFYMWILVMSYYQNLRLAESLKRFSSLPLGVDQDYGLELAVRRRRTKSLLGEDQLRDKLRASWYRDRTSFSLSRQYQIINQNVPAVSNSSRPEANINQNDSTLLHLTPSISNRCSESGTYEYWLGNEILIPRDTDRIMEQFVLMLMRVSIYLKTGGTGSQGLFSETQIPITRMVVPALSETTDTPPLVGSTQEKTAPYVRDYPQIFKKQKSDIPTMQSTPEVTADAKKRIANYGSDNTISSGRCKMAFKMQSSNSQGSKRFESESYNTKKNDEDNKSVKINEHESSDESLNKVFERTKKRASSSKNSSKSENEKQSKKNTTSSNNKSTKAATTTSASGQANNERKSRGSQTTRRNYKQSKKDQ